jgi:hypothetical protein
MDRVRVNPATMPMATDIHAEHVGSLLRPELRAARSPVPRHQSINERLIPGRTRRIVLR